MLLPTRLLDFPAHHAIAERILAALSHDERVLGICLTGSFAAGNPDAYSDLDFYILVTPEQREEIEKDHTRLRRQVGDVVIDFPATHLGDPHQFIAFYRASYPVHVDYQYRVPADLVPRPRDRDAVILLDRGGTLAGWKAQCAIAEESNAPTFEDLRYFEERFWAWCIYTDGKIRRGELWEARDAIEYLRNQVLIRLAYYASGLPLEGNRRLETKFDPATLNTLESTLPHGHSQAEYRNALLVVANCYITFLRQTTTAFGLQIPERDRAYFMHYLQSETK